MKVKELMAQLVRADQELEVVLVYDISEYWGEMYHLASEVVKCEVELDGPKKDNTLCLLIK